MLMAPNASRVGAQGDSDTRRIAALQRLGAPGSIAGSVAMCFDSTG